MGKYCLPGKTEKVFCDTELTFLHFLSKILVYEKRDEIFYSVKEKPCMKIDKLFTNCPVLKILD